MGTTGWSQGLSRKRGSDRAGQIQDEGTHCFRGIEGKYAFSLNNSNSNKRRYRFATSRVIFPGPCLSCGERLGQMTHALIHHSHIYSFGNLCGRLSRACSCAGPSGLAQLSLRRGIEKRSAREPLSRALCGGQRQRPWGESKWSARACGVCWPQSCIVFEVQQPFGSFDSLQNTRDAPGNGPWP